MSNEVQSWLSVDNPQHETDVLFKILKSYPFPSKLKNVFWKIMGLFIMQIEGLIKENMFGTLIREYLREFTENENVLDTAVIDICKVLHNVKYPNIRTVFNSTEDYIIRPMIEEKWFIFQIATEQSLPPLIEPLSVSDFRLSQRIQLTTLAVLTETGFGEFNRGVRNQIKEIKKTISSNLPIYRKCTDDILERTVYLTNRTYGIIYNILYNKILKSFIDKL